MKRHLSLPLFLLGGMLWAHPMGNFSVSHYSRIEVASGGVNLRYVLDLAEIPTFELLQQWKLDAGSPQAALDQKAGEQARLWAGKLKLAVNGHALKPAVAKAAAALDKGAGGMAILRVTAELRVTCAPGKLTYEDDNFPDRAGWKEVVITAGEGAKLDESSPAGEDRSKGLTAYPQDPLAAPPQDVTGSAAWHSTAPLVSQVAPVPVATEKSEPEKNTDNERRSTAPLAPQPGQTGAGMVVKGDFLSRLLRQGDIGWGMRLLGMCVAFGLGAIHALSPGHGKTIVAAYLVGSRGTPKHAAFLGAMVTFTHTISVFFLGFVTLFLSRYVLPEKIVPFLEAISGLSIVWIGTTLFVQRMRAATGRRHSHGHHHHHHADGGLVHDHGDGHVHSHVPEGEISMSSLIALGASGGMVPCPSALVLLLSSVALGRTALGLTLLVAFSMGLAVVLMAVGMMVLYAKHLLPDNQKTANNMAFRYLPVASAAIIVCAGVLITGVALGVIRPFPGI